MLKFVFAHQVEESRLTYLLDLVDYGKGPKNELIEGEKGHGFILKDDKGYLLVKG